MPAQIDLNPEYPDKSYGAPFEIDNSLIVKVKVADTVTDQTPMKEKGLETYIPHFFPEFYRAMRDPNYTGDLTPYNTLRQQLLEEINVTKTGLDIPFESKQGVILKLNKDSALGMRDLLIAAGELPDFQENLEFFNETLGIGSDIIGIQELDIAKIGTDVNNFSDLMGSFGGQQANYSGPVPGGGTNFNFLGTQVFKIMTLMVKDLVEDIQSVTGGAYEQTAGDKLVLYFSHRIDGSPRPGHPPSPPDPLDLFPDPIALAGITYFAASGAGIQFLKIGYFTLMRTKHEVHEQIVLQSLLRMNDILGDAASANAGGTQYDMFSFFGSMGTASDEATFGRLSPFNTDPGNPSEDDNSVLQQEAIRLGLIDVNDTEEMKKGLSALTADELATLDREVKNNPELFERAYQEDRRKKLETGIDVARTIERALEMGPIAMVDEGSQMDRIFQQIGLKALAREAMICLTFGLNYEMGRIAALVQRTLEEELNERPALDPGTFDMFMIKGDLWKTVLNAILNSVQKALFSLITQLAALLKELCNFNNPLAADYGNTDLGGLLQDNLQGPAGGAFPNPLAPSAGAGGQDLQDILNAAGGMTQDELLDYLSDLSSILTSLDICLLLNEPPIISDALMDRIIAYNLQYDNAAVVTTLSHPAALMELFRLLAAAVDVTPLCNLVVNSLIELNQDNICLTEDDLAALSLEEQNLIDDLLDIIENGVPTDLLPPGGGGPGTTNFDCPDAENYVEDPVMKKLIPETLSDMAEFVEMQFIASAASVKQILLEPVLVNSDGSVAGPYQDAQRSGAIPEGGYPELPEANQDAINAIKTVFDNIRNGAQPILDALEICLLDQPGLLRPEIRDAGNVVNMIVEILSSLEFQEAMDQMVTQLEAAGTGSGPLTIAYRFNQEFYRRFIDYIDIAEAEIVKTTSGSNTKKYRIPNRFSSYYARYNAANAQQRIQWTFPCPSACDEAQKIWLRYPRYNSSYAPPPMKLELSALLAPSAKSQLSDDFEDIGDVSLSCDDFVDAVLGARSTNGMGLSNQLTRPNLIQNRWFPYAYGLLTDQLFDYYQRNGVFTAAKLNEVSFFHNNSNCTPEGIADLLDVDNIIKDMQEQYLQDACNSESPSPRVRMRDAMKYGMFLLLIQVHVAEFIIKNVFLFAATQLTELFAKDFIVTYMRDQINASLTRYFSDLGENDVVIELKNTLIQMFNAKIRRPFIVNQGGIVDRRDQMVFPTGTVFLYSDGRPQPIGPNTNTATFDDIIDYLATVRIQASMGTLESPGPVANAMAKALPGQPHFSQEEIFLKSMPALQGRWGGWSIGALWKPLSDLYFEAKENTSWLPWSPEWGTSSPGDPKDRYGMAMEELAPKLGNKSSIFITKHIVPHHNLPRLQHRIQYIFWMFVENLGEPELYAGSGSTGNKRYIVKLFETEAFNFREEYNQILAAQGATSESARSAITDSLYRKYNIVKTSAMQIEVDDIIHSQRFIHTVLTREEMAHIIADPNYQDYFTRVFSKGIVGIVPIIQNFYLTNNFFPGIEGAMKTTKDRCLGIMQNIVAADDRYDTTPNMSRGASHDQGMTSALPDPESMARDFILQMLIKTPIDILKGVIEMIDPHVLITRLIKIFSGKAFNEVAKALSQLDLPSPDDQNLTPAAQQAAPFAPGADGGDIFTAILCLVNQLIQNPPGFPPPPNALEPPANFFPRITIDGVDFTGTGMGMLMVPPTPLGLIYLLLQLINWNNETDLDIGTNFGSGNTNAGDGVNGAAACDDIVLLEDTAPPPTAPLAPVRPPYVEEEQ